MRLWIGLAELKPNPKCKGFRRFDGGKGAYVHIAAWAESREALESRVQREEKEIDCILCEIDLMEDELRAPAQPLIGQPASADSFRGFEQSAQGWWNYRVNPIWK